MAKNEFHFTKIKTMANLYKSHILIDGNKKIIEYSTDESLINSRIQELTSATDLDSISFNIEHETALFSWEWTNPGGVKYSAIAQCEAINEDTWKLLDKF